MAVVREECPGSRGDPVESSIVSEDERTSTGECPICGARMKLGYAGLLPAHESGGAVIARPGRT